MMIELQEISYCEVASAVYLFLINLTAYSVSVCVFDTYSTAVCVVGMLLYTLLCVCVCVCLCLCLCLCLYHMTYSTVADKEIVVMYMYLIRSGHKDPMWMTMKKVLPEWNPNQPTEGESFRDFIG